MKPAPPFESVVVAGAGAWGTALALLLHRAGRRVTLWTRNDETAEMLRSGENEKYLPGPALPDDMQISSDPGSISACDAMLCVVPTQHLRSVLPLFAHARPDGMPVALCAKGIEQTTGKFVYEILNEVWPKANAAILSGPSFAADVAADLPTAVTLADENETSAARWISTVGTRTFRPYASDDLLGVALGGAVKNVLAIGCGVVEGRGLGESAKAALMTRGFAEILRLADSVGARSETLHGLSGIGDIVLTCSTRQSRNFSLGYELGKGRSVGSIMADRNSVAEGAATAPILADIAAKSGIDMPISQTIAKLVSGDIGVADAVSALMARPLKPEIDD